MNRKNDDRVLREIDAFLLEKMENPSMTKEERRVAEMYLKLLMFAGPHMLRNGKSHARADFATRAEILRHLTYGTPRPGSRDPLVRAMNALWMGGGK